MKSSLTLAAAAALLALSGCNSKEKAAEAANAANAAEAAQEAEVAAEMPPPIRAQKSYRCKDASVIYVDFFEGDTQASLHEGAKTAVPTVLKAETAGQPFKAEGFSITGTGDTITVERPGKGSQSCKG